MRRLLLCPQDGALKRSVYRVRGAVSASNYVQLPQTSSQSLGLTGRYLYVLFRPLPAKHFLIHLDVATEVSAPRGAARVRPCGLSSRRAAPQDGQVVRVSFSNLFKEFKSTATWLQFPFVCEVGASGRGNGRVAREGLCPLAPRWTCLQLDLRDTLLLYLNRRYGHLKSVRLCASLLVRNLYTSDLSFDPGELVSLRPWLRGWYPPRVPCCWASPGLAGSGGSSCPQQLWSP